LRRHRTLRLVNRFDTRQPPMANALPCTEPSDPDRQLALNGLGQQASHAAWILDVEAEQGGADELQGVAIALHHQIRDAPQGGVAEQDRAGVWIEQELTWTPKTEPVLMRASLSARLGQENPHETQTPQPRADHPQAENG